MGPEIVELLVIACVICLGSIMQTDREPSEQETIAKLEAEGAQVSDEKGELTVYLTNTDALVEIASGLDRMTTLEATFWLGSPVLHGPELRHLKDHPNLRELDVTRMPISGDSLAVLATLP